MPEFDPKVYRNTKDGIGSPSDDAATDSTGNWTLVALSKGLYGQWLSTGPAGGEAVSYGAGAVDAGTQRIVAATNSPEVATLGATTGAAVITDANGSIQQYLRGLVSRWANALGAGTAAAALRTTLASDDPLVAKSASLGAVSTATLSTLASSASSAQLIAANASRKGLLLFNTDANGVYIKYGTTASTTSFTVLIPTASYWEMPQPIYTGRIDAIWAADGAGSLLATEL